MPFDGSGNFTIINNFEEDRINGVSIDSLKMDNNFNDVANGLSNAMLRSGGSSMTGALNMASHKILNLSNGTVSTDAVNKGQLDAVDTGAVHKTGTETVTGNKTFSGTTTIASATITTASATTLTATTATVSGTLNIPGGKIWIA